LQSRNTSKRTEFHLNVEELSTYRSEPDFQIYGPGKITMTNFDEPSTNHTTFESF